MNSWNSLLIIIVLPLICPNIKTVWIDQSHMVNIRWHWSRRPSFGEFSVLPCHWERFMNNFPARRTGLCRIGMAGINASNNKQAFYSGCKESQGCTLHFANETGKRVMVWEYFHSRPLSRALFEIWMELSPHSIDWRFDLTCARRTISNVSIISYPVTLVLKSCERGRIYDKTSINQHK